MIFSKVSLGILITTLIGFKVFSQSDDFVDFIPDDYILEKSIFGDVNKDGNDDCILLIQGTDPNNFRTDELRGEQNRNRRGLIILINQNGYKTALKNLNCFSSGFENAGVYYPPMLSLNIAKGNIYIRYSHGRYGYWIYTFRYQNNDFELIGFDVSNQRGPNIESEISINYLTKRRLTRRNTYKNNEEEEPVFEETWENVSIEKLIKLSTIGDFDEIELPGY